MMAKMGILALPRAIHSRSYEITDMEKFLRSGIIEEENAKEECRKLSSSITDEKLSSFFEFINFQESYHIEIMKKLLGESNG
jgi:rubrerythrin